MAHVIGNPNGLGAYMTSTDRLNAINAKLDILAEANLQAQEIRGFSAKQRKALCGLIVRMAQRLAAEQRQIVMSQTTPNTEYPG